MSEKIFRLPQGANTIATIFLLKLCFTKVMLAYLYIAKMTLNNIILE